MCHNRDQKDCYENTKTVLKWSKKKPEYASKIDIDMYRVLIDKAKALNDVASGLPGTRTELKAAIGTAKFAKQDGLTSESLKSLPDIVKLSVVIAYTPDDSNMSEESRTMRKLLFVSTPELAHTMIAYTIAFSNFAEQIETVSKLSTAISGVTAEGAIGAAEDLGVIFPSEFISRYLDFGKALLYRRLSYIIACFKMREAVHITSMENINTLNKEITDMGKELHC
jgi:hypothetical protein